jgi:hypothetical protein
MNKIPLASSYIYEFFIDENLVDEAFSYFMSQNIDEQGEFDRDASLALYCQYKDQKLVPWYYEKLFVELQKYVDEVCNLHFISSKLAICDSWLTKSTFGKHAKLHNHNFSIFSGLLYLTDSNTNTKFYMDDSFYTKNLHPYGIIMHKQDYILEVVPKKGKLIIWDSSIKHSIATNKEKTTRYTLAFNTWLTGNVSQMPTGLLRTNVDTVKNRFTNKGK